MICSRAPTRICDIGGWTDTRFYKNGAVFNIANNLYTYCFIKKRRDNEINVKTLPSNLINACIKSVNLHGIDVSIYSEAPIGSGMGTSASLCVALLAGLYELKGYSFSKDEIARDAHKIETGIGLESGVQDQYASAFGGIRFYGINYPLVIENDNLFKKGIREKMILNFESRLSLIYVGRRLSSNIHEKVIEEYNKNKEVKNYLDEIRDSAFRAGKRADSIYYVSEAMNTNWEYQKRLHPDITTQEIRKLEKLCKEFEVQGFKVNGAGGGGSVCVISKPGEKFKLEQEIKTKLGLQILPVKINTTGVEVYRV